MTTLTRRQFLGHAGAGAGLVASACAPAIQESGPSGRKRVVVIGGGWGGATAAKYVRLADPRLEVILFEPNQTFISCPLSNLVLSGVRTMESLTFGYAGIRRHGVTVRHQTVAAIEPDRRRVRVGDGWVNYDRLIVSPGIDFLWDRVEGLAAAQDRILHAWKAGPETVALARQIQAMPDGGTVVLSVPLAAYRCPPGPYERACQIAWYLKQNKPRAKLLVLDANPNVVSKPALFRQAWTAYPNLEYRPASGVIGVDAAANVIPPQRAAAIAVQADLVGADKRWCEVNHVTYESVKAPGVHVLGDATIGIPVPKSGNVANAMGKVCAIAVVSLLNDRPAPALAPGNTCYSFVSDREAIAVVNAYRIDGGKVVQIEQKLTPGQSADVAQRAHGWAQSIWSDMLA
jgi:sulfide dehydrogenase [flavocytochrome c] flavoprotein subunit